MRTFLIATLATVAFTLSACGAEPGTGKTDALATTITANHASPADFTVKKGDTVKLTFTTDKDEEVHLHGFDIHFDCKAGVACEKTFTADRTGKFEYELEKSAQHLGDLTVTP